MAGLSVLLNVVRVPRKAKDDESQRSRRNAVLTTNNYFVTAFRSPVGDPYITLVDNAPTWLKEAVHEAHGGMMPNDWVFSTCADVWSRICEMDDPSFEDGWIHEFANSQVDIYTKDIYNWAAQFCLSGLFSDAEEQARDLGAFDNPEGVHTILGTIQYCCVSAIANCLWDAYIKHHETKNRSEY